MISIFDMFKIGIGPSSSHTMGPMAAAAAFRSLLARPTASISVEVFGSLAWTGRGHATDSAIFLGLLGELPCSVDPDNMTHLVEALRSEKRIHLPNGHSVAFEPDVDLVFNFQELLPFHTNGMRFRAYGLNAELLDERILYSIGGGFVTDGAADGAAVDRPVAIPFESAKELLEICSILDLTPSQVQLANELALRSIGEVTDGLDAIRDAMFACIDRGLRQQGELPGGLRVFRRAQDLHSKLTADRGRNSRAPHEIMDWVSLFALSVNEENAAGARVVTAPTNGAAGVVPAVLRYCRDFCPGWTEERGRTFLLTAGAIGGLIKRRASISGAEVGCQGEVGSAAAMAAAGLAAALGANACQIENAAEIAMEHHLGMTCDPVGGLVQIPCIERNALGAQKAIVAASLALRGDGVHRVSLDEVVETMRQTGTDMQSKYKETSLGGLAVNVPAC